MKAKVFLLSTMLLCMFALSDADARRHRLRDDCGCASAVGCEYASHSQYHSGNGDDELYAQAAPRQPRKRWPWGPDSDEVEPLPEPTVEPQPEPTPDPTPVPVPDDPLPSPVPEPTPDPEPLPPEPLPDAGPTPSIPSDPAELNSYVAKELGGFVRANHERNGVVLDIYQARGKQRIVWETAEARDWMSAIGRAFWMKSVAGASNAGLVLICDDPEHPIPEPQPQPEPEQPVNPDTPEVEPLPQPDVDPLPEPDAEPAPEPGEPTIVALKGCGGQDLVDAQKTCEACGLWLVVVRRYGGEVNRVIYNP